MKGRLLMAFAVVLMPMSHVLGVIGPVHVELNMIKPRISAARANTFTAFKIYFRYNLDIKSHDWVKIWFPIDEYATSDNPVDVINQICDGLPTVDGKIEHQRFIPNEQYFINFENPHFAKLRQIYEGIDEKGGYSLQGCPDVSSLPDWGNACGSGFGKTRLVKDPSGLGCWMLGTVFPSMPLDKKERWEVLRKIIRTTSLGYSPCGESQGYPIIINNCKERSYQQNSPLVIEAWRKGYNSIDWNCSRSSGFLAPATPGRYRIAVATLPEPEPVESEAFVLPCSDVSDVRCAYVNGDNFTVRFKTGEGGALDGGSSTIMLKFPPGFKVPKKFAPKTIKINGAFVTSSPQVVSTPEYTQVTIIAPTDVSNLGEVKLEFMPKSSLDVIKTRKPLRISLSTSSEPVFMESDSFNTYSQSTTVSPNEELAKPAFKISSIIAEGKSYPKDSKISISFPEGFNVPKAMDPEIIKINGSLVSKPCEISGNTISVSSPVPIDFHVAIEISNLAGILNPLKGAYKLGLAINGDMLETGSFDILESKPRIKYLDLSDNQGSMVSSYTFEYEPSTTQAIEIGDILSIEFPSGTTIPKSPDSFNVSIDNKPVLSIGSSGTTLKIGSPVKITYGETYRFFINCGIANPRKHGEYVLKLIAPDGQEAVSPVYNISPSPLKSRIYFKDPDKPNCGEWFNKPPILGFECLNPEAKIKLWVNGNKDNATYFYGETRILPGFHKTMIAWQAEFGDELEKPQTFEINIDTTLPILNTINPVDEISMTNISTANIEIVRIPQNIEHFGQTDIYAMVDGVDLIHNGTKTELLPCQIYKIEDQDKVQFKITNKVNLSIQGENIFEIIARDFACNETRIKKIIFKDTKAPDIELIEPLRNQNILLGDVFKVKARSESGAVLTCNGKIMDVEWDDGINAIYVYKMIANKEYINIVIVSKDKIGNMKAFATSFIAIKKFNIWLTIGKTEWTVDGIPQPPLKTPPTSTFRDPKHKAFNGTTFMPIAEIAPFLDCAVSWNPKEKKVTLTQKDKTIEMWLNKTSARIDGKEVKYNTKGTLYPISVNGKTLIPLRFVAENLGADVVYNAQNKTITIAFPKGVK